MMDKRPICKYSQHYPIADLQDLQDTQYISSRLAAARWKDWFNRLQINDSFLSSFWLEHLPRYGNYQLSGIYYYIQDSSVWLLGNMCRGPCCSVVNTVRYLQTEPPHLGNQCYENLMEFLRWLHNWWIWDHIGVDFGEHIEWFEGTCEYW